jgi:hypothetical protein
MQCFLCFVNFQNDNGGYSAVYVPLALFSVFFRSVLFQLQCDYFHFVYVSTELCRVCVNCIGPCMFDCMLLLYVSIALFRLYVFICWEKLQDTGS